MSPAKSKNYSILAGTLVGLLAMFLTAGLASAAPVLQGDGPTPTPEVKDCGECHLDIANNWASSPHAHAFDDTHFQERWTGMGEPGDCLACHTTNYQTSTGEYTAEGVYCEACHGEPMPDHPPGVIPIKADSEYCGECHTTTLGEWRLTGHSRAGVGCMDCHDPHSQQPLFDEPDDMCLDCHKEDMEHYLEDLHLQKDIGCVDCHALVIPPEELPEDGIVPTGHTFTISPSTCVACHTDTLHAGLSLPGYEDGAKSANGASKEEPEPASEEPSETEKEEQLPPEQRIQALEAALASQNISTLFQGGVVGLVFGGSTAWIVARNIRRMPPEIEEETDDDKEEG